MIEPLVYGHNTGISPIAVVASATFWTWLWGPIGLVLSTPLTVCLVVMGRHVDRLAFLDVLLGDAPPLTPIETFYQRMLAGDPSEIADHAETYLREHSLLDYCDEVALPALLMAQADVRRGVLEEKRQTRIRDTMRGLVADLDEDPAQDLREPETGPDDEPLASLDTGAAGPTPHPESHHVLPAHPAIDDAWAREGSVLCVAGRTPLDEAAAWLLADLLRRQGVGVRVEASGDPASLETANVRLVILSFLDADLRVAQARFAIRRLRRRLPDLPVACAFWMAETDEARTIGLCADVRSDVCVSNLPDAIGLCLDHAAAKASGEIESPEDANQQQSNV